MGNYTISQLPAFDKIFLRIITKIQRCILELYLKMLGWWQLRFCCKTEHLRQDRCSSVENVSNKAQQIAAVMVTTARIAAVWRPSCVRAVVCNRRARRLNASILSKACRACVPKVPLTIGGPELLKCRVPRTHASPQTASWVLYPIRRVHGREWHTDHVSKNSPHLAH